MGVSLPSNGRSERDNKGGPGGATNIRRDLTSPLSLADKEADVDVIATRSIETDPDPKPRTLGAGAIPPEQAVPVLQRLLAGAILTREQALAELERIRKMRVDKHWFVSGLDGYCAACGLPEGNGRHVARAA